MRQFPVVQAAQIVAPNRDDQLDLGGLFTSLGRRLTTILLAALAGLMLGLVYLAVATPRYTASTSLFVDPRYRKIVTDEVVQGSIGSDLSLVETQVSIIASDNILRRVVEKHALDKDTEFVPARRTTMLSGLRNTIFGPRPEQNTEHEAIAALARALKVKRAQKTYVVDIEVTSSSPVKAAALAQSFAEAYLADQSQSKNAEIQRAAKLIDARLGELQENVRKADAKIDEYKNKNNILSSEGNLVNEQQLTRLNTDLVNARTLAAEAKARFDEIKALSASGRGAESATEVVRSPLIQRLREQYAAVARREASLSAQLQPRHPVMIEARTQVAEIRSQIDAEIRRIAQATENEYKNAISREREMTERLERSKAEASTKQTAQIRLRELQSEADASRDVLRAFTARAKETQAQQTLTTPDARVITPALVPDRPSRPINWLILSLGLIGGLGAGITRALLVDHLDQTLRTPEQILPGTGYRLVASIPELDARPPWARMLRRLNRSSEAKGRVSFSDLMTAISTPSTDKDQPFRQSILRMLQRLKSWSRAGHPLVVMLTSTRAGAGASATALSLAYASAIAGDRTLLIDASSRDAELSHVLARGLDQKRPIVLDSKEHLAEVITIDTRTNLAFLPIALADLRTLKLDARRRLAEGLTKLVQDYDIVIMDAGGLLEDETVLSLAHVVDQIMFVVKAGSTDVGAVREALESLDQFRDRIGGVIMTMTEPPERNS